MAQIVLIAGPSSSGKSTSMRNFASDELALINVNKKPLPFKGKFESLLESTDYDQIRASIAATKKRAIVIDDAGYLITHQFMSGHRENKGNAVFELYNDLADNFYKLIKWCQDKSRVSEDKIVYFVMHIDKNDFGETKPKTIGKMLDEKVCIEGLFTVALTSEYKDGKYVFHTKTDGLDFAKSPIDMFESDDIDNDLKAVDKAIRDYYGLAPLTDKKGSK